MEPEAVLPGEAFLDVCRQLRQPTPDGLHPFPVNRQRHQVGFGEIAVVLGLFLGAHDVGLASGFVPGESALLHLASPLQEFHLPPDLVCQAPLHTPEGVQVFHLGTRAELIVTPWPYGDIGVAPQVSLLHVGLADAGVLEGLLQALQVTVGLLGRADIRLADDLNQRRPAAVEVDVALFFQALAGQAVDGLAGVLLQVDAGDAHRFGGAVFHVKRQAPALADRLVVLRYLVPLGQVRVEVVLTGEA